MQTIRVSLALAMAFCRRIFFILVLRPDNISDIVYYTNTMNLYHLYLLILYAPSLGNRVCRHHCGDASLVQLVRRLEEA